MISSQMNDDAAIKRVIGGIVDTLSRSEDERAAELYHENGYVVIPNVFSAETISYLLDGVYPPDYDDPNALPDRRHSKRSKSGKQTWKGAPARFRDAMRIPGEVSDEEIIPRGGGRFDLKLREHESKPLERDLGKLDSLLKTMLIPKGRARTQNVMLAKPGATQQEFHFDQDSVLSPAPIKYLTVLIPLTENTPETKRGGTLIVPGTHKDRVTRRDAIPMYPLVGSALIFDGRLWHAGMANSSETYRYIFYMAFASVPDGNVI